MSHRNHGNRRRAAALVRTTERLRTAFVVSSAVLVFELAGGLYANSLALLSDAGHVFTDIVALGLAWFASAQTLRPATHHRTYGFFRAGILAALANALTLVAVALFITWEAVQRLQSPEPVDSLVMLLVAIGGLVVNLYVAFSLHEEPEENLNVRSALLHVIGDILGSVAVVVGAVVISLTGWLFADPLLSVLIALIIAGGAWSVVAETLSILMEGTPKGVNVAKLIHDIKSTQGVMDAHDFHVWSLAAGIHAMSAHVVITDQALSESASILRTLAELLAEKHGIDHVTIQFEHRECGLACALFHDRLAIE